MTDSLIERLRNVVSKSALEIEQLSDRLTKLQRMYNDQEYLLLAYHNMLGEKGVEVAQMWIDKKVTRVHFSWGPKAHKLSGEQRAQFILDLEKAPKTPYTGDL